MFQRVTLKFILAISILAGLSLVLYANTALAGGFRFFTLNSDKAKEQYQIGEEWSRRPYNRTLTSTEAINKAIKATARVDLKTERGTAFYVGKFGGVHLMMTNYHVMSSFSQCREAKVYFEYSHKTYKCGRIIEKFKNLEATFFTITVSSKNEYLFENVAMKFDFTNEYKPGHKVVTAGYGVNLNGGAKLTYEISQTCMVATTNFVTNFITVKGKAQTYGAYSFAHACEISHGDSGSALVSEGNGKVIGINWATDGSKPLELLSSLVVFDWIEHQVPELWTSLSYAAPSHRIMNAILQTNNLVLNEFVSAQLSGQ